MKPEEAIAAVRRRDHDRDGHHRRALARARDHGRFQRPQEGRCSAASCCWARWPVAGMFFIYQGDWLLASVLFILANIGANGSYRLLRRAAAPHRPRRRGRPRLDGRLRARLHRRRRCCWRSTWPGSPKPEWFGLPSGEDLTPAQATLPARLSFLSVAVWWLVFSIPLFRRVPEPKATGLPPGYRGSELFPIRAALARLVETGRALRPLSPGRDPDAPGLPDLQRRHRHHHAHGHASTRPS